MVVAGSNRYGKSYKNTHLTSFDSTRCCDTPGDMQT